MHAIRPLRASLVALLVAVLLPITAIEAISHDRAACPSPLVPATRFTDTRANVHRSAIDCAAWWEVVQGTSATSYSPGASVTRGQTAAMVARLLRATGVAPDTVDDPGFNDTADSPFVRDIALLSSMGIVSGTTPTTFEPAAPIARAQMASILVRTLTIAYGQPLPSGPVPFADVSADDVHRDAIGRLVAAGITSGTSATTFAPRRPVARDQMASFVTRVTDRLVVAGAVDLPTVRPPIDDAYASRMRAAWVHLFDDTLKTPAGVQALVAELAAADANTVIAQVARRHDAYYDSDVLPRTRDPRIAPGFDVLEALVTAAHAAGIEVHAWYGVAPTWHDVYRDLPAPDGWLPADHGRNAPVADRWVTRTSGGAWSEYLDPGVPAVRAHVAEVVRELADRYEVDGIHLDYVRYQSADHGYNPVALQRYREETGATSTPAPGDPAWSAWRRAQTRGIVTAARDAIAASGRDVALTAAVISWNDGPSTPDRAGFRRTMPYTRTLQDWDGWVRDGLVDGVMPMNYFRSHVPEQRAWFASWLAYERALAADADALVVPGPGGYLNRPDAVVAQVRAAMQADGAAVYSFQQPTEDGSRGVWRRLAETRWGYHPRR